MTMVMQNRHAYSQYKTVQVQTDEAKQKYSCCGVPHSPSAIFAALFGQTTDLYRLEKRGVSKHQLHHIRVNPPVRIPDVPDVDRSQSRSSSQADGLSAVLGGDEDDAAAVALEARSGGGAPRRLSRRSRDASSHNEFGGTPLLSSCNGACPCLTPFLCLSTTPDDAQAALIIACG